MLGMALCILSPPAWRTRRQLTWIETHSEPLSTNSVGLAWRTGELTAEAPSWALGSRWHLLRCVAGHSLFLIPSKLTL